MANKKTWSELRARKLSPKKLEEIDRDVAAELVELNLRAVRELVGKTQSEAAGAAEMTQGEISRFETRDDHLLGTLRRYIEALGGELEVRAIFGDRTVKLRGV